MSGRSRAMLCLLQRSVGAARIAATAVSRTSIVPVGRRFVQDTPVLSGVRGVGIEGDFRSQSFLKTHCLSFSTKSPVEDEYPPLPDYQCDTSLQRKEVYIIQVKGLPWSCTPQDLLQFFSECRIREGLNGIHLTTNRQTGKPTGQAFIEVEHEDDVCKALEKHRHYLGPRYVEVFEVTNKDAEAILKNTVDDAPSHCVVRLRGLPFSSTQADIVEFFSGLDIVQNGITIVTDHQGRNSGQAYVEFTSQEACEEALRKDRELIGNRYIEVFPSRRDEIRSSWRSRTSSGLPQQRPPPRTDSVTHSSYRTDSRSSSAPLSHYVHMRGLPFSASGWDIVQFFSPLAVSKVIIEFGPDGRPSGEGGAYFGCHQEAVSAMSKDRTHIGERYIELFLNSEPDGETK